jgi:hypothetical protein
VLGLDLIAAHLAGDYLLQTNAMAERKLHDWRIRLWHVSVYSLPFLLVLFVNDVKLTRALLFLGLNFVIHFILDSRRWASGEKWAPRPIVIDQTLHVITLAVLAHFL